MRRLGSALVIALLTVAGLVIGAPRHVLAIPEVVTFRIEINGARLNTAFADTRTEGFYQERGSGGPSTYTGMPLLRRLLPGEILFERVQAYFPTNAQSSHVEFIATIDGLTTVPCVAEIDRETAFAGLFTGALVARFDVTQPGGAGTRPMCTVLPLS